MYQYYSENNTWEGRDTGVTTPPCLGPFFTACVCVLREVSGFDMHLKRGLDTQGDWVLQLELN